VSVIYSVRSAGFAQHPSPEMGFPPQIGADQLDRHHTVDEDMAGSIHDAHATLTNASLQSVTTGDDFAERRIIASAS
jgi:hypothetical protein